MSVNSFPRRGCLPYLFIGIIYLAVLVPAPGISLSDAGHDDGLFMRWSVSILKGQWLGPWDVLTTSKGPLHSLFTAVAAFLGVNPYAYKRLFYLAGSLVFVETALHKAPRWLRILTFVSLLCDPFQYGSSGLRNLREGTYIPLQLIAFGLGSWALDQLREKCRIQPQLVASIIGTATGFGLIMVTREARILAWLELSTWLLLGVLLVAWNHWQHLHRRLGIKLLAGLLCVILVIGWAKLPVIAISALNTSHYHASISNSTEEGEFPIFYGRLLSIRVKGEPSIPRVPARQSTLDALLNETVQGSPLRKILKNIPSGWETHGCKLYPETCGEIGGGWFMWALRDGISASLEPGAGEDSFQRFVQSASSELYTICRHSSTLACSRPRIGYMPSPNLWGFRSPIEDTAKEAAKIASLVLIPSISPQGEVDLGRKEHDSRHKELAGPLGITQTNFPETLKWEGIFRVVSFLGAAGKSAMILIAIISILLASMRSKMLALLDPVAIWLLFSIGFHLAMYTLLGLTSFPGDVYVTMASPLFIGLLARLSAFCMPLTLPNKFQRTFRMRENGPPTRSAP